MKWVGGFVLLAALGGLFGGGSDSESCADAYRNDYLYYGEPESMSLEDYCENYNDTSYIDEMGLDETYE